MVKEPDRLVSSTCPALKWPSQAHHVLMILGLPYWYGNSSRLTQRSSDSDVASGSARCALSGNERAAGCAHDRDKQNGARLILSSSLSPGSRRNLARPIASSCDVSYARPRLGAERDVMPVCHFRLRRQRLYQRQLDETAKSLVLPTGRTSPDDLPGYTQEAGVSPDLGAASHARPQPFSSEGV